MIKKIGGLVAVAGLLLLMTTATSSDLNLIGIKQIVGQASLAMLLIIAGCKMGGVME